MAKQPDKNTDGFSLLHPMAMGGIHGGGGYSYQDRYIVCHIPAWIADPEFVRIMPEGTGDVDVVFLKERTYFYDHIQVKDHLVTVSEFKEVVAGFSKIDKGTDKIYRNFILASPAIGTKIKPLTESLKRFRHAQELFDSKNQSALKTTKEDLLKKINGLGLNEFSEFIIEKIKFQTGAFDLNDNGTCKRMFVSSLVEHPNYKNHFTHIVEPVYSVLIAEVLAHRGKVLESEKIHLLINGALSGSSQGIANNVLHFHNWTVEKFEPASTIVLDWSALFDRTNRIVPGAAVWNTELVPQLLKTRQELSKTTTNRHIIFRGRCALSSGIALGMTFPEIGNWTFELLQPPQTAPWRSDAAKLKKYKLKYEIVEPSSLSLDSGDSDIAFVFNISGRALEEVVNYLKSNQIAVKKIILIHPSQTPGTLSIQNDSEAVSLASAAKDILKELISKFKVNKTHLFYFGPFGLSIFLGQKLTSVGQIQLYEFQDPSYKPSCLIKS
jgi:hypothetical protein